MGVFFWHLLTQRVAHRRRCRMCGAPSDARWCGSSCRGEYLAFYQPGS